MDGRGVGTGSGGVVARVVGGERFGIRNGRSGRRYVLSRIDHRIEVGDLDGAVVVITAGEAAGTEAIVWVGRGEEAPCGRVAAGRAVHAHWLAETDEARAAVIADLAGVGAVGRRGGSVRSALAA